MSVKQQTLKRRADQILKRNKHTAPKQYADTHKAMRLFLMLGFAEPIGEAELRECERRLKLPKIRLHLDRDTPFSSLKGRRLRIFDALRKSHPGIVRHCVMRTR